MSPDSRKIVGIFLFMASARKNAKVAAELDNLTAASWRHKQRSHHG